MSRLAVTCGFLLAAAVTTAPAQENDRWQLGIGPVAGGFLLDSSLRDYRWDTRPAVQSGLQATLYRGRFAAATRLWHSYTTQETGIPGVGTAPQVHMTSIDLVALFRLAEYRRIELWGAAHAGRLHFGYDPDELTFTPGGGGSPVTVAYDPIHEWNLGMGAEIRHELTRHVALSLQAEASTFALDTAHRAGSEIVLARERYYNWALRIQLAWLMRLG